MSFNPIRPILRRAVALIGESKLYRFKVIFADGSEYTNYEGGAEPELLVRFKTVWAEWWTLIFFPDGLFEKYVDEEIDLEGVHPVTQLAYMGHASLFSKRGSHTQVPTYSPNPLMTLRKLFQEWRQNNWNYARAKCNAEFHYAIHPALFEQMLGETVGYSEGYWTPNTKNLNQAKHNNYEYICRKLRLKRGDKVLEVGAGWGFLPIYMVKNYGVDVTMYNPVKRQNDYMAARFKQYGVADKIRIVEGLHQDIRDEPGESYDKFVTIGVHEHHGMDIRMYRLWLESIEHVLKLGGLGLISSTTFMERYGTSYLTLKYIFPGGNLPSLPHELMMMGQYNMMLVEIENLWPHYQKTLAEWRNRFTELWPQIQKADPEFFTERFRRLWSMYLAGSTETFDGTKLDLSHILFTKGRSSLYYPWTREEKHHANFREGEDAVECYPLTKERC